MSFGKMNSIIEIKSVINEKDDEGFAITTETLLFKTRAYRQMRHASEKFVNLSTFSDATDIFKIRRNPKVNVTTRDFIVYENSKYDILSVENVRGKNMYLEIVAKKVDDIDG